MSKMSWNFGIVNKRLVEIYFEERDSQVVPHGHCYVTRDEFTTKREQKEIDADIKRYIFTYWKNRYKDLVTGKVYPAWK